MPPLCMHVLVLLLHAYFGQWQSVAVATLGRAVGMLVLNKTAVTACQSSGVVG